MSSALRLLVVMALLANAPTLLRAQSLPKLPRVERFAFDAFQLMLQQEKLSTTQDTAGTALEQADQTVCVILGDMANVWPIANQLTEFVDNGGALLIASDLGGQSAPTELMGVLLQTRKAAQCRPQDGLAGFTDCPIIRGFQQRHPIFAGVREIATNRPGELAIRRRGQRSARLLAQLPLMEENGSSKNPTAIALAMGKRLGGKMLVIADHSIFTNEMIMHKDNARFCSNVAKWMCQGTRQNLVLIRDGELLSTWGLGNTPPPVPLETLLRAVSTGYWSNIPLEDHSVVPVLNETLATFQRQNGFNHALQNASRKLAILRPYRLLLLSLATIVGVVLIRWLLLTPWRAIAWKSSQDQRHPGEPTLAAAAQQKAGAPCLRTLARQLFRELGAKQWTSARPSVTDLSAEDSSRTTRDLRVAWKLATGQIQKTIKPKRFRQALQSLQNLRRLQTSGRLRVEWGDTD